MKEGFFENLNTPESKEERIVLKKSNGQDEEIRYLPGDEEATIDAIKEMVNNNEMNSIDGVAIVAEIEKRREKRNKSE